MSRLKRICVFCGSSAGSRPAYAAAARELGSTLGERGVSVVFGGGKVGLMGVLADAALAASIFHFREVDIRELKNELKSHGVNVRL